MEPNMTRRTLQGWTIAKNEREIQDIIEDAVESVAFFGYNKGVKWDMMAHALKQCITNNTTDEVTECSLDKIETYFKEYLDFFYFRTESQKSTYQ